MNTGKIKTVNIYIGWVFTVIMLLAVACNPAGNGDGSGDDNKQPVFPLLPPNGVTAEIREGFVTVTWENVTGAENYQLYKQVAAVGLVLMPDGFADGTSYSYKEYSYDKPIAYAVQCCNDGIFSSNLSCPSKPVTLKKEDVMKGLKPDVASFALAGSIIVRWDTNPYATAYLLYRYRSPDGSQESLVYEGKDLSYTDKNVTSGQFYYYKLIYKENSKLYSFSPYAFGMTSYTAQDEYEDNNKYDDATVLQSNSRNRANIYYYKDSAGNRLLDDDWYYVKIPPNSEIPILLDDFTGTLGDGDLFITVTGQGESRPVIAGSGYRLINTTANETNVVFSITVNPERFYNEFGGYTIYVEE